MHIRIAGSQIVLTGRFRYQTHRFIRDELLRQGARRVLSTTSDKADFMIAGYSSSLQHSKALAMGLPIIDEAQLDELLLHGELELHDEVELTPHSELFGELRSLIQRDSTPSAYLWQRICELLDRSSPDELDPMVHYVESFVSKWDGKMSGLIGTAQEMSDPEDIIMPGSTWANGIDNEVRILPYRWISELLSGEGSSKHALSRGLSLEASALNGAEVCTLLLHPALTRVTHVALPLDKSLSKNIIRALHDEPLLGRLKSLRSGKIPTKISAWFDDMSKTSGGRQGVLEHLDVTQYHASFDWSVLSLPYFANVNAIQAWDHQFSDYLPFMRPGIERLLLDSPNMLHVVRALENPIIYETLRELKVYNYQTMQWKGLLSMDYQGQLDVLDLGTPLVPPWQHMLGSYRLSSSHLGYLRRALPGSTLLKRVKQLRLGHLHDAISHEALLDAHPHLTISV